jgi:hypothetical protein
MSAIYSVRFIYLVCNCHLASLLSKAKGIQFYTLSFGVMDSFMGTYPSRCVSSKRQVKSRTAA